MKKVSIILLLALICAGAVFGQGQKPVIAVYIVPDDADNSETKAIKKVLGDKLTDAIVRSGVFTATERSEAFLSQIMKEQDFQRGGRVRDDQIVRQARASGAQYLCIADITEVFGERYVTARLIHTESNDIAATTNSSGAIKSMNDLVSISGEVSNNLIKETPQAQSALRDRQTGDETIFYIESAESNLSKPTTIVGNQLKSTLAAKRYSFTNNPVQADFWLKIEAKTRYHGDDRGFTVCYADVSINLIDARKNANVFNDEFSQKGISTSQEAAGRKALEDAVPVIVKKISQFIKK
jgi:hypothetical protein